jgi:flagellin
MSVLRIYNNPLATNALRNLSITSSSVAKSLERLSSGLRINRAADDAAGLSISEKLRAQIRGLNRASSNALDGISLIQTAEGALNEVHSILQRMRELSVQAANGIYTADDRQAIQLEISQLTDEINRIADTTEFNTKTLLDGTLGALISTDDYTRVSAAVVGNVGKGGNFVMKAAALSVGQLQIQKTDVFATTLTKDAVGKVNYLKTWQAHASFTTSTTNTGIMAIAVPVTAGGSVAVQSEVNGRISVYNAALASAGRNYVSLFQASGVTTGDKFIFSFTISNGAGAGGKYIISFAAPSLGTDMTSLAGIISSAATAATNAYNGTAGNTGFSAVNYDAANGRFSFAISGGAVVVSGMTAKFVDNDSGKSSFQLSFNSAGTQSNVFIMAASIAVINNGNTFNAAVSYAANGGAITIGSIGAGVSTGHMNILFDTKYKHWGSIANGSADFADTVAWSKYGGKNTFAEQMIVSQSGAASANGTYLVKALSNRTFQVFSFDNAAYTSLVAGGTDQSAAVSLATGTAALSNATGTTTFSIGLGFKGVAGGPLENIVLSWDKNTILQTGETATFNVSTNNVLTADQANTLSSINRFQDFGVFNGRNNVELTVYLRGSSQSVTVNLFKNDTLEDMAGKLSLAIWNPDGSGVINSGIINPLNAPDLVHVNTIGSAKGTVSITTPVPGAEVVFAGDEKLLKALSLIQVQEGVAPTYSINAFNLETGTTVGSVEVQSSEITGLLPGLKVFFDNTLGIKIDPDPPTSGGADPTSFAYLKMNERPTMSLTGNVESFFIHVAPRDFTLQVGANEGQTISSYIGDMSAKALGVEGLLVVDSDLAQESISIVDHAINKVSNQRSRLGALQNRLESTIRNLDVASENLSASESRIRDADVALETVVLTRNQILLQAGVAALAQANSLPQTVLQLLR